MMGRGEAPKFFPSSQPNILLFQGTVQTNRKNRIDQKNETNEINQINPSKPSKLSKRSKPNKQNKPDKPKQFLIGTTVFPKKLRKLQIT